MNNKINEELNDVANLEPSIIPTGIKHVDYSNSIFASEGVEFDYGSEETEALMGSYF